MPAIISIILAAIPEGIQLGQLVANLIEQRTALQTANRPDVSDADAQLLDQLIDGLQAKIIADAAKQP
jgi:hypothetical protein